MATQFYSSVNISKLNSSILCPSLSSSTSVQLMKRQQMFDNLNKQTDTVFPTSQTQRRVPVHIINAHINSGLSAPGINSTYGVGAGFESHSVTCRRLFNICKVIFMPVSCPRSFYIFPIKIMYTICFLVNRSIFPSPNDSYFSYKSVINPYISAVKSKDI